jgi:hypothetical protein
MTFRSRTLKTVTIALAVASLGASAASAAPMTYQERQAIASRGVGAPVPRVVIADPTGRLPVAPRPDTSADATQTKSSDGANWGAIVAIVAAALAACVALVALSRRHAPATPS